MTDHAAEFREKGFTVARGFYTPGEAAAIRAEIEAAGPDPVKASALNRRGLVFYSNAFRRSRELRDRLAQAKLVDFLRPMAGGDLWVRWDQAVLKRPGGAEFPWHQDNAYNELGIEHYQVWIALSRSTPERGGIWFVPGSHRKGLLPHRTTNGHKAYDGPVSGAVPLDAEPGDLILFSSYTLHYTSPNVSEHDRWAYVAEYVRAAHFDPFIPAPYYMVASGGKPAPRMTSWYRGRLSPSQQLRYAPRRLARLLRA